MHIETYIYIYIYTITLWTYEDALKKIPVLESEDYEYFKNAFRFEITNMHMLSNVRQFTFFL